MIMKKTVLLFLLSDYADWEAGYVAAELNCNDDSNPYCIKTISISKEYTNAQGYVDEPAVLDGNIITANGSAPLEFARLIFSKLQLDSEEVIKRWYDYNKLGKIEFEKMHATDL